MPSSNTHHWLTTMPSACGVKYKPSAPPITHWPALRSGLALAVGTPAIVTQAVASSGPTIHGTGVRSATHNKAAAQASRSVSPMRVAGRVRRR